MKNKCYVKFIAILLFTNFSYSQAMSNQKENYKWFDNYIGIENTGLFNGLRYKEEYRTIDNNHKFYLTSNFINGDITYDGQTYYDIKMKYDLYEDQIIVNLASQSGNSIIQLLIDKIEGFSIKGNNFVKLLDNHIINSNDKVKGLYKQLYQSSNLILYKKNKKIAKKHLTKKFIYYTFKNNNDYYLYFNSNYYIITSKKSLIKIFPNYKKEINSFYTKNKALLNSNYGIFLTRVSSELNRLIANNSTLN